MNVQQTYFKLLFVVIEVIIGLFSVILRRAQSSTSGVASDEGKTFCDVSPGVAALHDRAAHLGGDRQGQEPVAQC